MQPRRLPSARVVSRIPLIYAEGADPSQDRPAHVRAGSGIVPWGGGLAIVQDDALFLAIADPSTGRCRALPLPSADGVRQFDARRGNKMGKPDLEAAFVLGDRLVGLGSGSAARRDRILVVRGDEPAWFDGSALYAALAARTDFAGSELNIEGAAVVGGVLRLFNRGNGEGAATDATCDLDLAAFGAWLDGGPVPEIRAVVAWSLGTIGGVRLTFTDATASPDGTVWFLAAAEASPNAVDDGVVVGAAIGTLGRDGPRWSPILERGVPIRDKVEGITFDPRDPRRAWVVVDPDDPDVPATLLGIALEDA